MILTNNSDIHCTVSCYFKLKYHIKAFAFFSQQLSYIVWYMQYMSTQTNCKSHQIRSARSKVTKYRNCINRILCDWIQWHAKSKRTCITSLIWWRQFMISVRHCLKFCIVNEWATNSMYNKNEQFKQELLIANKNLKITKTEIKTD